MTADEMRLDTTPEEGEASRTQPSLCCRVLKSLLLCTGEIKQLDVYMEGMWKNLIHMMQRGALLASRNRPGSAFELC